MSIYSIKDLERISGIKAHTIRIWEQRYGIVSPERTDTNIRNYHDEDLKTILNISILNNNGVKISKIAKMTRQEVGSKVMEITNQNFSPEIQIDNLIIALVEMNEDRFEKFLSSNIVRQGFEKTFLEVIHPFMVKVGALWMTNAINPAQEHFISHLVRQKIIAAIDGVSYSYESEKPKCLLYLPEKELHEITLLFANLMLRKQGFKTVYLGQSVPYADLDMVSKLHKPLFMITVITCAFEDISLQEYIDKLCNDFKHITILLSGYQLNHNEVVLPVNCKWFNTPEELMAIVNG